MVTMTTMTSKCNANDFVDHRSYFSAFRNGHNPLVFDEYNGIQNDAKAETLPVLDEQRRTDRLNGNAIFRTGNDADCLAALIICDQQSPTCSSNVGQQNNQHLQEPDGNLAHSDFAFCRDDIRNSNLFDDSVLAFRRTNDGRYECCCDEFSSSDVPDDSFCSYYDTQTPGTITRTVKHRAKSADLDAMPSVFCADRTSAVTTSSCANGSFACSSLVGGARSADAMSMTNTFTFKLVPTCLALRRAVLALYRLDDFEMTKIGQGFFSEVFKVRHKTTGEVMVLKLNTMSSNRPNVLREVQTMRRLKHPNVLRFRGVCVDQGQLHALTDYCSGGSLEQVIKSQQQGSDGTAPGNVAPFPWAFRVSLALDIARGMQYVHNCGYIHRDLTSKNVLLKRNDRSGSSNRYTAVIADFGLSCKIPAPGKKLAAVGSPYWMAPECLNGDIYCEKSDVFSYGIILCEIIARIDADPDCMPRTHSFGLDYVRFSELCPLDTPLEFLKLAFRCCLMDSNSRPSMNKIVPEALKVMKGLQETTTGIGNILAANGVSPVHSHQVTPLVETVGLSIKTLKVSTPLRLSRCHSDVCISDENAQKQPAETATANEDQFNQSPSSALNRALAHRIAADDPFYTPADDGEAINPFASHHRFAGGKKIVTDSCFATPSISSGVDKSMSGSVSPDSMQTSMTVSGDHRLGAWKPCLWKFGCTVGSPSMDACALAPIRRAFSLPGSFCEATFDSLMSDTINASRARLSAETPEEESPTHTQVRRVTQVFEEQDKLFVDSYQKQRRSMKKALTFSSSSDSDSLDDNASKDKVDSDSSSSGETSMDEVRQEMDDELATCTNSWQNSCAIF